MPKVHVPSGFRRIIDRDTRKIRIVERDMAPFIDVAQQRTGEVLGRVARSVCEPLFGIADASKSVGRAIANSNFGVGAQYGWQDRGRRIAIRKSTRHIEGAVISEEDIDTLRQDLVEKGIMTHGDAYKASPRMLAEAAAEATIEDTWMDADSLVLFKFSEPETSPSPGPESQSAKIGKIHQPA